MEKQPVQRGDWQNEPMPALNKRLQLDGSFTDEEFRFISFGVLPESMEDKWFVYHEAPWLYLHRSWTGYCIYQIRFEPADGQVSVVEVVVNRDPQQYSNIDDEREVQLLDTLTKSIIERYVRGRLVD